MRIIDILWLTTSFRGKKASWEIKSYFIQSLAMREGGNEILNRSIHRRAGQSLEGPSISNTATLDKLSNKQRIATNFLMEMIGYRFLIKKVRKVTLIWISIPNRCRFDSFGFIKSSLKQKVNTVILLCFRLINNIVPYFLLS